MSEPDHDPRTATALARNPAVRLDELAALHASAWCWALSRCGHVRADAEDLLQGAYARIVSGAARFDGRSQLRTFVFGVIERMARDERRGRRLHSLLLGRFAGELEPSAPEAPERSVEGGEHAVVWAALRTLPPRQRDVLELVFHRDCTIEQAAAIMGVSLGSARTHYERGKRSLAARLAPSRLRRAPA